jgi:UDP-N-acetylglucosamine/UDP-N-acetylgalactosamine diphosphorylase
MLKKLWRKWGPNPLDLRLKRAAKKKVKSVLITWNRGMGDVPLGMYALIFRIRQFIADIKIAFLVRGGLKHAFSLLEGVEVHAAEHWKRGGAFDLESTLEEIGIDPRSFDMILENPDPTQWLKWQLGTLVPKLRFDPLYDALADQFGLEARNYIALHVHTETQYGYEKNWQVARWKELCERLIREKGATILLFGLTPTSDFAMERVIDLRGKTTLFEMLSLVKNRCTHLVAPDSGVLSIIYYLDVAFPLRIVSLWADPRQGVLKQNVTSPNPDLQHVPLIGKEEKVENITVEQVLEALALEVVDPLLKRQREALLQMKQSCFACTPLKEWDVPSSSQRGSQLIQQGKMGCLVLAGGQGSRFGTHLPKGLVPVTAVKGKTLFQLLCEKTKAASIQAGCPLSLAIMTSPLNHELTCDYLESNERFGLSPEQVSCFMQETLPFLDDKGHWLWDASGKIARGPNGNGYALSRFYQSGIWQKWKEAGIEYVNVVLIDNPLADPFDPFLVAAHAESQVDVTLKCVPREHAAEKVGVVGLREGKVKVVEYLDLPQEEKALSHWHVANISLFCFSMDFIAKVAEASLPWHLVRKGGLWKFETFIFDLLDYTDRTKVLLYPREETYAPLKNAMGEASLETVRLALLGADRRAYAHVSGLPAPEAPFELDPVFHYPTHELFETWKGKELPNIY